MLLHVVARCTPMYTCDLGSIRYMGRSIELTGLPRDYRTTQSSDSWLKVKFETIPVSKQRYERLSIPNAKPSSPVSIGGHFFSYEEAAAARRSD